VTERLLAQLDRPFPDLSDALHEAAIRTTGFEDFGDDEYREGFAVLMHALEEEADLSPMGRAVAAHMTVNALASRLHAERGWRDHSACLDAGIEGPLVIVGLPRTGTTALHHLLAHDPANQGLELWLGEFPMVRPPRAQWEKNDHFIRCRDTLAAQFDANPDLIAAHEMNADEVDECWHVFRQSFASVTFECTATVPSYSAWWSEHDMLAAYQRHRDNLKLIGHGSMEKRWVLKDPSHLFAMEALFDVYPGACVVLTHRHPVKLIPSVCSLNSRFRAGMDNTPDPVAHGREQLELWGRGIDRTMEARRSRDAARFFDMDFRDFVADPVAMVRRIYDHFGFELTPAVEQRLIDWQTANPQGKHGAHHYTLEEYGLSANAIEERFAAYLEEFQVTAE